MRVVEERYTEQQYQDSIRNLAPKLAPRGAAAAPSAEPQNGLPSATPGAQVPQMGLRGDFEQWRKSRQPAAVPGVQP